VDGDTINHNGTTFRLWGIDAPENKQWCGDYPAGVQATATLEKLIKGKVVTCEKRDVDRYGRTVAVCRANGDDLGAAMVRLGMAWHGPSSATVEIMSAKSGRPKGSACMPITACLLLTGGPSVADYSTAL